MLGRFRPLLDGVACWAPWAITIRMLPLSDSRELVLEAEAFGNERLLGVAQGHLPAARSVESMGKQYPHIYCSPPPDRLKRSQGTRWTWTSGGM